MSDLSANNRYSLDNINANRILIQNVILPKSQPVRLKALMQFENDDDDDDDDNDDDGDDDDDDDDDDEQNEENSYESENESDSNEPLPQESMSEILQDLSLYKTSVNSSIKLTDRLSETIDSLSKENREIETNISSMQKRISCTNDKQECKTGDINCLSIDEPNKLEICNNKNEEKAPECHSGIFSLKSHPTDAVHDCLMNVLPPPSLSVHKGDYNTMFDMDKNLQSLNSAQSHHKNIYKSDILNKRKEEDIYDVLTENKMLARSEYLLNVSKEDQWYKGVHSFVKRASKDCKEESHKIPNIVSESVSCALQTSGNLVHPARYNSQYSVMKYEANEKYTPAKSACTEFSTPLSEAGKSLTTINRIVSETPLKHLQASSMHPNPCTSHKQLFQTPQNKLCDLSKSQTPATILSSWCHNNVIHTPMEKKSLIAKDHPQFRNPVCTSIVEKPEPLRYFEVEAKTVKRPLVNSMLVQGDSLAHSLEPKPLLLHIRSEAKGVTSESQQEDKCRKTVGLSDMKLMQTEKSSDNNLKSAKHIEEAKKNKQSSMHDTLPGSSRNTVQNKNEIKQMIIGTSTAKSMVQNPSRNNVNDNVSNAESNNSHEHYSIREKQHEELQQIVDKVGNVQLTVSLRNPSQRQGKTIIVKDKEYMILGFLGQGMSGEVLRVQEISCGDLRAIKCVDLNKMDKESAQGCLDEISMLLKLQASCVVKMFDYQIKELMVYVVMEMGDTDLSRLLKSMSQEKQIPLTMILYYWTEMLAAVKHIHDNGVIHSDLKPGNFLLVRGRLKLIDFGIASNINSDMTSVVKNNPIGTLNYISPEALMDIGGSADSPTRKVKYKITFKSDVWSLGCILYSMVYGCTPFQHIRSQWAKMNAITNPKPNISFPVTMYSPNRNSQNCERAPPVLIDVMRKCLQHNPKARPTVSELLQVQYVPTTQNIASNSVSLDISANILVKIKHALNEEEWRQLIQTLDRKRQST